MVVRKINLANNPLFAGPALSERHDVSTSTPYKELFIDHIKLDPSQPRKDFDEEKLQELAESIKEYGILLPLIVREAENKDGYILVAGERRLRASKIAGLQKVPVVINNESQEEKILEIQLVENLQRVDLNSYEKAKAIFALKETYQLSVRDVAAKLGISKSAVQRSMDVLKLPDDLIEAIKNGAPESKILLLANIESKEERAIYLNNLNSLSHDVIQGSIKAEKKQKKNTRSKAFRAEDQRIASELQSALGLKVRISRNQNSESGKIVLDFYNDEDLQHIFRSLSVAV